MGRASRFKRELRHQQQQALHNYKNSYPYMMIEMPENLSKKQRRRFSQRMQAFHHQIAREYNEQRSEDPAVNPEKD